MQSILASILLVAVVVALPGACVDEEPSGWVRAVQGWQAAVGDRYRRTVDDPPLPRCAAGIRQYLDGATGVMAAYHRRVVRRAKADVIELESLKLDSSEYHAELDKLRRAEKNAINAATTYRQNLDQATSSLMVNCYVEAKEGSTFFQGRGSAHRHQPILSTNAGFLDTLVAHPVTRHLFAYVVVHSQVFFTSALVVADGFITTQLTGRDSPWRSLGEFMERCFYKAQHAWASANSEWEGSMVSISALSEESGVVHTMLRIWGAYGHVLQLYATAAASTIAPFLVLVFLIVISMTLAPVVVWYNLGYVLLWLVWLNKFLWHSLVVPEIGKVAGTRRMGLKDAYTVSERLLSPDASGDGGALAAIPIAILVAGTAAVIIVTATSLVLLILDVAGQRWEGVDKNWEDALRRVNAASEPPTNTKAKRG